MSYVLIVFAAVMTAMTQAPDVGSTSSDVAPVTLVPPPAVSAPTIIHTHRTDGHTTMRCIVDVSGHLRDCKITSESPAGRGFGAATLKVAHLFKVKPAMRDGHPVEAAITIPLRWDSDDDKIVTVPAAASASPPNDPPPTKTITQAPD